MIASPPDDIVNGRWTHTVIGGGGGGGGAAYKKIMGRSAIFKMVDRSTISLYAGGELVRHLPNRLFTVAITVKEDISKGIKIS